MTSVDVLTITATSREVLHLGTGPEVGNRRKSSMWVTGATLRGAMAARWIGQHGSPGGSAIFAALFNGTVRWPWLLPADQLVVPLSVRRCKYRPFPQCALTAIDGAFGATASTCACGGRLEPGKGELVSRPGTTSVQLLSRTSSALDDHELPVEGKLFTIDGLPFGVTVRGSAVLAGPPSDAVSSWLSSLAGVTVRVGGRRSVSGTFEIERVDVESVPAPAVSGRLALRLASPAVIVDDFGAGDASGERFLSGTPLERVTVVAVFARPVVAGGWSAVGGIPKPVDVALATGTTVVVDTEPLGADEAARLLRGGVGVRRAEGFGEITVAHEAWAYPALVEPPTVSLPQPANEAPTSLSLLFSVLAQAVAAGALGEPALRWVSGRLRTFALSRERRAGSEASERFEDERFLRTLDAVVVDALVGVSQDGSLGGSELARAARIIEQPQALAATYGRTSA